MRKTILSLLVLFYAGIAQAQQFELGKVTKEELEQKSHPLEPDAPAAILFESGTTYMDYSESKGFVLTTETDIRIKIYTKEGYDWANESVRYFIGNNPSETVSFSKAVTYNIVNGNIEKTKLKSEGEFDEKVNKFWALKKITMPNVKEGSVIEYRYVVTSPFMSNIPTWSFQNSIPVNHSKYVTKFPEYYVYKTNYKGFIFPTRTETSERRTYSYTTKDRSDGAPTSFSNESIEFKENITTYTAQKMPSMKEEGYVSNIDNYRSSVEHELSVIKFPNSPIKSLSTTWEDVVKTIYDSDGFGNELKKTGYFEEDIKVLIAGLNSNDEKIAAVFNYVKGRMSWNNFTGYSCDDGVKKAYKDKVGNTAEINLMLTAMLRNVGITANPVLVSTRANGISFFPNRTAYNYVICAVENNNKVLFLDASDKYALPNIIPVRALNWNGRIIRENGSSAEVDLMPKSNSKDIINLIATFESDGKLKGKLRDQYFDYNAFVYRQNYTGIAKDNYLEKLEKRLDGIEIEDYVVTSDDFSKPVTESYSFTHGNVSEVIGDKIYFSPLLFLTPKENPFKQDKREYPVDFVYPSQDKYAITITIPEGYAVESMPAPAAVTMGEGIGKFTFNITSSGKQIQIAATLDINEAIIAAEDYETLKNFYKAMIEKENEKIVLKKI
jgi:transglutaminase-like putative cysteine protease